MNDRRRTEGDETWMRLLEWTRGQKASERLSGHIIASQGFHAVDPSHPLGGKDGLKDLVCTKNGRRWVAAAYFPRGRVSFSEVKDKFESDAEGVKTNMASGFVFITNQYLTLGERKTLKDLTEIRDVEIYHLERITHILNTPKNYGIRLEFLDIEMTKEEQLAFFATLTGVFNAVQEQFTKSMEELQQANFDNSIIEELDNLKRKLISMAMMFPMTSLSSSIQDINNELDQLEARTMFLGIGSPMMTFSIRLDEIHEKINSLETKLQTLSFTRLHLLETRLDAVLQKITEIEVKSSK